MFTELNPEKVFKKIQTLHHERKNLQKRLNEISIGNGMITTEVVIPYTVSPDPYCATYGATGDTMTVACDGEEVIERFEKEIDTRIESIMEMLDALKDYYGK